MVISIHWQDADSSSALSVKAHYPDVKLMLCGGHVPHAHQKMLKSIKVKKSFTATEQTALKKKYPEVNTAECHCPKHHSSGCGCMSDKFITVARSRFFGALVGAGTEPKNDGTAPSCQGRP